ncbi:ATP-binding protein [Terasakiella sp. A23]|nr:ATP-binding protein [Terasakiella sp. A23]
MPSRGVSAGTIYVVWALLLLAVIFVTFHILKSQKQDIFDRHIEKTGQISRFYAEHFNDTARYADDYIKTVRRIFLKNNDLNAVRDYMAAIAPNTNILSHITIMDKNAVPILISNGLKERKINPGTHARDRTYFKHQKEHYAEDRPYFSDAKKGRNTGLVTIRLVRPIVDRNGDFNGLIFAAIKEEQLLQFYDQQQLGDQSTASLVGMDKRLRFRKSAEGLLGVGQDISQSQLWDKIKASPSGVYKQKSVVDGITRYWEYNLIPEYDLVGVISIAESDLLKETQDTQQQTLFIALLAVLVICGLSFSVLRGIKTTELYAEIGNHIKMEEELRHEMMLAKKAHDAQNAFLSQMSHELRTPLNSILGFTQLLALNGKDNLDAKQQNALQHINESGTYLLELIEKVLDFGQIQSDGVEIITENAELGPLLKDSLRMIKTRMRDKQIKLHKSYDGLEQQLVQVDETRTKQILLNLLSNAVKYNVEGGSVAIELVETEDDHIRVKIRDTGIGISEEHQPFLFEPFKRLGQENSTIEGTGVGLTICKHLCERMDARLGYKSEEGVGSTFWIDLKKARS